MKVEELDPILSKTDLSSLSAVGRHGLTTLLLESDIDDRAAQAVISLTLAGMDVKPQAMAFSLAQLAWLVETSDIDGRYTSKTFKSGGLAISAIVAARRCYARVGEFAPIVEAVAKFFAHVDGPHEGVALAREIMRATEPVDGFAHEEWTLKICALQRSDEMPAGVRCLLEAASLTLDGRASEPRSRTYSNEELCIANAAFEIVATLASEVSEVAAREFIAALDALGAT
jgi:hypothetical protein